MKNILIAAIAAVGVTAVVSDASAWSCSQQFAACKGGILGRGGDMSRVNNICGGALSVCKQTGVWDTSGNGTGSVRKVGLEKR